jgi:uncharacterized protein YqgC (DUF456 family)
LKEQEKQTAMVRFSSFVARVVTWEVTLALVVAGFVQWRWGREAALAVLYAASLSVINMLILGSRLVALPVSGRGARRLGGAVLQRWTITIVGLLVAIAWLHLPVIGLVAGLLLTHFVFLGFMLRQRSSQRS